MTTVCAGTHQAVSPVSVPKDTSSIQRPMSARVSDSFHQSVVQYSVTSALHVPCLLYQIDERWPKPAVCFCLPQMWTSVSLAPVLMESVGTAKGPMCVCVQWAVRWTALSWSV